MSEPEVEILRALLLAQAQRLWSALMAATTLFETWREAHAPRVGDYVFVLGAANNTPHRKCIGVLKSVHLMSSISDTPIDFTIELLDGRLQHWEHAEAVKLFASTHHGSMSIVP